NRQAYQQKAFHRSSLQDVRLGSFSLCMKPRGLSLAGSARERTGRETLPHVLCPLVTSAFRISASGVGSIPGDTATLASGYHASGGSITFTLTDPNGVTTTVGTVSVTAPGTYAAPTVTATQTGTYTWHASYSGDGLNTGASDNGQNESLTIGK